MPSLTYHRLGGYARAAVWMARCAIRLAWPSPRRNSSYACIDCSRSHSATMLIAASPSPVNGAPPGSFAM